MGNRNNFINELINMASSFSKFIDVTDYMDNPEDYEKNYISHIDQQRTYYLLIVNTINDIIHLLKKNNIVSDSCQVRARIKAFRSALKNSISKSEEKREILKDIFGIECIFENPNDEEIIHTLIKKIIGNDVEEKPFKKDNGYVAKHYIGEVRIENFKNALACIASFINDINQRNTFIEDGNNVIASRIESIGQKEPISEMYIPLFIEFQVKSKDVYDRANSINGSANHCEYKNDDGAVSDIQYRYNMNANNIVNGIDIPFMWVSDIDSSEKSFMRELTKEEILRKLYPSIELDKGRDI